LLVVIAIIGILVALLLPAVQAAREAARRMQCQNNLKQLGLALHNYHDQTGGFPPGIVFDAGQNPAESAIFRPNWIIRILPNIEQQSLYDAFNFQQFISHSINRAPRGTELSFMKCPSDGFNRVKFSGTMGNEGDNWARGNYAANGVNGAMDFIGEGSAWSDGRKKGVMACNVSLNIGEIKDGTSNVVLVGEIRAGFSDKDRRGTWAMGCAGASGLFWHGFEGDDNGPNFFAPGSPDDDDIKGCNLLPKTQQVQNRMTCCDGCPSWQQTMRSLHQGGVYTVFADGSVHFISDFINTSGEWGGTPAVWDYLIASGDGNVLSAEAIGVR
jgi:type II secretory pathway pseudopilin PulG